MTQLPLKKYNFTQFAAFFHFLFIEINYIFSHLKGVFYQSCRFCISKPNWCVPVRDLIFKDDILRVSSCTYVCPAK